MEFFLFLPQIRMTFAQMVATARAAEAAGFTGMAGMDHFTAPRAEDKAVFDAIVLNTWIAAHTERLKVASLVMCDAFRHPAILAKQAVSLDHASGGRFELGIGWGSWQPDFDAFGIEPTTPAARVARLRETLQVLRALWSGETVSFQGEYHRLEGAQMAPTPLGRIPILVGGAGPKTLALVKEFADWCNIDVRYQKRLEGDELPRLREQIGTARISIQQVLAYVHAGADREAVGGDARRRFGAGARVAAGSELHDHFAALGERGVERVYAWFADFARPETLAAFGEEVIRPLARVPAMA
jgi:alkanesulfonate monooxygenase SsuD/methylene tetrahydromethanopterin reductase-like flavin-dependent oxidoreductase (luciferase family)